MVAVLLGQFAYTEDVILLAIRLVARNALPEDAAMTTREEKGVKVSGRTVQRWADGYPGLVAAFAKDLEIEGGDAVSVDEKHYRSRGEVRWMARAMCMATHFILASDHWPDKLNHDATPLYILNPPANFRRAIQVDTTHCHMLPINTILHR